VKNADFQLESSGKRKIWGTLVLPEKPSGPALVMAHGFLGFKDWAFFPWLAEFFAGAGFPAVRFNFSGSGMGPRNDGPFNDLAAFEADSISRQVEDLKTVLAALRDGRVGPDLPPQEKILLWGHSRGGAVCLLAGDQPLVGGIAAWAPISRVNRYFYEAKQAWRRQGFSSFESSRTGQSLRYSLGFLEDVEKWGGEGDVPTYLSRLKAPVLLVHGLEDTSVPPGESESLEAVQPRARLVLLAGADHKFNSSHPFGGPSGVLVEAAGRTVGFFRDLQKASGGEKP
jgi:uncharacterized protein